MRVLSQWLNDSWKMETSLTERGPIYALEM